MPCSIKNPANIDLGQLEPHIHSMYDHFDQKLAFSKPPTMIFDSDPSNQANVLGKTAYYDPNTLEIHIYSDGRHPKDMLRSIAHELIHHQQNMEGRLVTGGYQGEGYYLENKELKKLEHEAMLNGNAMMREWEDTIKKENNQMSLKEWKNNELSGLLLKKFGILKEAAKPDYLDLDKDGDKEESMKDAAKDKEEGNKDNEEDNKDEEEVVKEQQDSALEEEYLKTKGVDQHLADTKKRNNISDEEDEEVNEQRTVNIKEVVRRVLENNKKVMQKLKDN